MKKQDTIERWSNSISNYDKITKETAQLMLDQSTKLLIETSETAKGISTKATQLIAILIPLSTVLIGYVINNLFLKSTFDFLTLTAILCVICVVISSIFCYKNFKPYNINIVGEYPHDIVAPKFVGENFIENQQFVNLLLNVCDNIENRVLENNDLNEKKVKNNLCAINTLFIIPFCPALSYLILLLFHLIHCAHALS